MAVISGTSSSDTLNGTAPADEISGLGGDDTLSGRGGGDTLLGGIGNDSLLGGSGADSLVGGAGVDTLDGGGGNDTYVIDASDVLADGGGIDTVRADFTYALLPGFENLVLLGAAAIDGTGNGEANTLTGNGAANQLRSGKGDDTLDGRGGDDTLVGGPGADNLAGGAGDDTYIIDALDVLIAGGGIDTVRAGFTYTLLSGFENLILAGISAMDGTGNNAANEITGNNAANLLLGGGNDDLLNGSDGADTLVGGAGDDTLLGGDGDDLLIFHAADASVRGGEGTDTLRIDGSGMTLDLTLVANTVYRDIEVIDLTGAGDNGLILARGDALAFSSTIDTLQVQGDAGDAVVAIGAWNYTQNLVIGSHTYAEYTNGLATLHIDTDIDRSGVTVASMSLGALDGANGFRLDGIDSGDRCGISVASAGDVNGDGFADLIVGADDAASNGNSGAGESYVVFGRADDFDSALELSSLDGATGFRVEGIDAFDRSGHSVASAGDVNGDGFDDFVIGAWGADVLAGASYVVFGGTGFSSALDLAALDGTNGFRLEGVNAADYSARSVASAGDVNGDGFNDLIIGVDGADPGGEINAGGGYVVFGSSSLSSSVDLGLLNGSNGFRIDGIDANDRCGFSVSSAGDVNGDGYDDLLIGAVNAANYVGESYVVFGGSAFSPSIDLDALDGTNGFRMDGVNQNNQSGISVASAGDVNGDGFADLIIGALQSGYGGYAESYVVFGASSFASAVDLGSLDGANGFRLDGFSNLAVPSVASAGDINGDGFTDLIVGAPGAGPDGNAFAGQCYVVFGGSNFDSSMDLGALDGSNGFRLEGADESDFSGASVASAGDVNGDGFDDLIIGARSADPGGYATGASYVVFGGDFTGAVTVLGTSGEDTLTGTASAESFVSGQGDDTVAGGGGADVFRAGEGNDVIRVPSLDFADVDGGSGMDTLDLLNSGHTLDLTALANNKITGIEVIDITGSGNNTLDIAMGDLLDLSDSTNQLTIKGNSGDTVSLVGTWTDGGAGATYHTYTLGAATVLIDNDIFVT